MLAYAYLPTFLFVHVFCSLTCPCFVRVLVYNFAQVGIKVFISVLVFISVHLLVHVFVQYMATSLPMFGTYTSRCFCLIVLTYVFVCVLICVSVHIFVHAFALVLAYVIEDVIAQACCMQLVMFCTCTFNNFRTCENLFWCTYLSMPSYMYLSMS